MALRLAVYQSGQALADYNLEGEMLFGRGPDCPIRLDHPSISRRHGMLRLVGRGIFLEKKSDLARILVNGAQRDQATLKLGDVLGVGDFELRIHEGIDVQPAEKPAEERALVPDEPSLAVIEGGEVLQLDAEEKIEEEPAFVMQEDDDAKTSIMDMDHVNVALYFEEGQANCQIREILDGEIVLGRSPECDIVLNDQKASRQHARILRRGLSIVLEDLGSVNGVYLNGQQIKESSTLSGEDRIRIADTEFRVGIMSNDYIAKQESLVESVPEIEQDEFVPSQEENGIFEQVEESPIEEAAPSIVGIAPELQSKKTLLDKFRALPKMQQSLGVAVVLALFWFLMDDTKPVVVKKAAPAPASTSPLVAKDAAKTVATSFEALPDLQKRFIEAQHGLAFDYYTHKEYDKAIFEISKIFSIIQDFKDSQEILRYAKEGKKKLEAMEDERKKKADEMRLKAKVEALVIETSKKMKEKKYDDARELFAQVLSIDPDNPAVADWRRIVESFEEKKRLQAEKDSIQRDLNKNAKKIAANADALYQEERYYDAVTVYKKVLTSGAELPGLMRHARAQIDAAARALKKKRDPLLEEAQKQEKEAHYEEAIVSYKKVAAIDPRDNSWRDGLARVKLVLHERARGIYTEAILAEGYSEFDEAQKKFRECLKVAPVDDEYHDRAMRKLSHYFRKKEDES